MSYNPNGPRGTTGTTGTTGTGTTGMGGTGMGSSGMGTSSSYDTMNRSGDVDVEVELEGQSLRSKAENLASTVKDKASQLSSTVSEKANTAITSMGEKMTDMGHALRDKVPNSLQPYAESIERAGQYLQRQDLGDFVNDLSGIIRRHPMPAMLTGVALGFFLARTARR